ncbi:D-alanyl-D-alanine carboxypeptidase [Streptomyces sp. PmtG]
MAGEFPDMSKTVSGGGASDDDAAASPPTRPSAGEANGDARLRNAVAAWVASADGADDADDAEGTKDAGDAGDADGVSGDSAGGDVSPERAEGDGEPAGEPKPDKATAVFRTDRLTADAGSDASSDASSDAGERRVDQATQVFKAVPSWAKTDDADDADDAEGADDVGDVEGAEAASKPESKPEADSRAEAGTDAEAAAEAAAEADSAPDSDSDSGAGDGPVDRATAVFKTVRRDADAKAEDADDQGADQDKKAAPGGTDEPERDAEAGGEGAPKGGAEPKGDSAAEPEPEPKPEAGAGDRGLDQATAVFKAVRPTGSVDQPTTMLKLGGDKAEADAKAKPQAKPQAKPRTEPESESERTSKFVALKPLDEPRATPAPKAPTQGAPKPEAAAPQAPAPARGPVPEAPERTTQQPLPPKPPLDLLAELTNTPPPPETPTRTLVRRVKIWTPLVLLLAIVFAVVQAVRPLPEAKLNLTAKDTFSFGGGKPSIPWPSDGQAAMDVDGIGTFGTSGKAKPVPIASIAKVMTTYLILRDHPIKKGTKGKTLTVDAQAQRHYEKGKPENESVVKVTEGQKIKQYEALQAVMLPSANNVARMLARWDSGGDEKKFVAKMNKTAKELGMTNTHYTDPSGLDKTTVSTAEDLVKLGRVAMENPTFKEIARQPKYDDLNGDEQKNYFGLVPTVAIGIKTGTTTAAGGNILFAAEKRVGGKTQVIIGAALAQFGKPGVANIDQVTNVVKELIGAGQDALTAKTVVKKGTVVGHVDDGLGGTTPVVTTKDVTAVGWSGLTAKLELSSGGKDVPHTAKKGTKVGVLAVGDGTNQAIKVPVVLQKDLSEPGLGTKLTRVG